MIYGIWPGSAARLTIVRREPRREDWKYEYIGESGNRFAYFGEGQMKLELSGMTAYLKDPETINLRTLYESWRGLP